MIRVVGLMLLLTTAAQAGQIDYLMQFTNQAVAINDAVASGFYDATSGTWSGAAVIPGVVVEKATGTDGNGNTTWTPATGYWILASLPARNSTIEAYGKTMLAIDRDVAAQSGWAAGLLINRTGQTLANLAALWCITPQFASAQSYPIHCVP
jgi:hypothetical protein